MSDEQEPRDGRAVGWIAFFIALTFFSCVEVGMITDAMETGNWATAVTVGIIGLVLGAAGIYNMTRD